MLTINRSVGKNGNNQKEDVIVIQMLLNLWGKRLPQAQLHSNCTTAFSQAGIYPNSPQSRSTACELVTRTGIGDMMASGVAMGSVMAGSITRGAVMVGKAFFSIFPLPVNGHMNAHTIRAIEEFQRQIVKMPQPDGRVDPNGRTLKKLNQIAMNIPIQIRFPLQSQPKESYKEEPRKFGSSRKGKRKHAGCDLYAPVGTSIFAMENGIVIQNQYFFYCDTYALEVHHGNFVARYGEISGVAKGIKKGSYVKRGEVIAYVGKLSCYSKSMLHLEMYSGKLSGSLTVTTNPPYKRRADLLDPTQYLDKASMI